MKSTSSGQAKPATRSIPPGNGADRSVDNQLDYPVIGKEPEPEQVSPMDPGASSREEKIAIIAYFKAERRGFANSGELDDWLEAEREVDRLANGKDTEKP